MSSFLKLEHQQNDFLIHTFDNTSLSYLLIRNNWKDKYGHSLPQFPRKPCPIPDQNGESLYPFSDLNSAKNPTLWGGTHLQGLYTGSPPPPSLEVSKVKKYNCLLAKLTFWVCWLAKKQTSVVRINGSQYYWRFFLLVPKKELSPNDTFKFGRQRV